MTARLRSLHEKDAALTADMMVDDVMRRWPATIRVFLDFRMGCVGCPIATFHSVDEACREHSIDRGSVPVDAPGYGEAAA